MSDVITWTALGRFGNACTQYLFVRALAEQRGAELQCCPWLGERMFDLPNNPITETGLPRHSEMDLPDGGSFDFHGYAQHQRCADLYTRSKAREWLRFRPAIAALCWAATPPGDEIVAHHRVGDMLGYGYCQVSRASYYRACMKFGFDLSRLRFVTEEDPTTHPEIDSNISFAPDFYRLCKAPVLLRGNSTFSFIAGLLNTGRVFAPIIDGLDGGATHECDFVESNSPRLANLEFISAMEVAP